MGLTRFGRGGSRRRSPSAPGCPPGHTAATTSGRVCSGQWDWGPCRGRRRGPAHRSTSAVAQRLTALRFRLFDPAQRRPGCCASAGPDREALAVGVCRVGVCCSGPGWVQCGEMPNPPMPAGLGCSAGAVRVRRIAAIAHRREDSRLGCSAAQGSVFGTGPRYRSPRSGRRWGVRQRRGPCSADRHHRPSPRGFPVGVFGSAGVRVRRIATIAHRREASR